MTAQLATLAAGSPVRSSLRVQRRASTGRTPGAPRSHPARAGRDGHAAIHAAAARGIATPWSVLPHAGAIQRSFGHHDVSSIQAHVGDAAAAAAAEMSADAYTTGNHVVLGRRTDLFTAAHESAHAVQQRAGVQLKDGVGAARDRHEQHADAVAACVTAGRSAEALLDTYAGHSAAGPQIQRKTRIVDDRTDPQNTNAGTGRGLLQDSEGNIRDQDEFVFGPLLNDCGTYMEALITLNHYDPGGTEPQTGTWPSWWNAAAPKPNNYWVRGHLLNHHLGGPGEKRNLTPITKRANSEHHNNVEKVVKMAADLGDSMIRYRVEAKYNSQGPTGLNGDAADPNPAVWDKLTLGFHCEYIIIDDQDNERPLRVFVENRR